MTGHSWEGSYPPGVKWDIDIPVEPAYAILDKAVAEYGPKIAIDFLGKTITYAELGRLVDRAATGFRKLGVKDGTRVALFLPNCPQYIISFFGVLKAGGIVVNLSPLDALQELQHKVSDSSADFIVTLSLKALYPQMARLIATTPVKRLIVGSLQEMLPFPKNLLFPIVKRGEIASVPRDDRHMTFAELLDNDGGLQAAPVDDPKEQVAVLQYTGGTTGLAKGAMLTHHNLVSAYSIYRAYSTGDEPTIGFDDDAFLVVLPLFHIFALQVNMFLALGFGSKLILHPRFELDAVLKDIDTKKPTVFPGVPAMFQAILNHPDIAKYDLSSLRHCVSGGAPLPLETLRRFEALTGTRISEGWGMTETSPAGTGNSAHVPYKENSCGLPQPRIDIKVYDLDTSTKEMAPGEKGEICIKGPNVMKGYWNNEEATKAAFNADGYFRTGDSGYIDEDGYVFLVDRIKDMILVSGFNVYPRNIEEAIYQHPDVEEVIVIGIDDPKRGQAPKAFVKLKAGAAPLTLDALQEFLKDRIGRHEMVRALDLRDQLPKTPVGKLSKKELYAEEQTKEPTAEGVDAA